MKRTTGRVLVWIAALMLIAAGGLAGVEVHVDEELDTESTNVQDDYLFLGKRLAFTGSADSLYFLGRELELSGNTRESVFAMARDLDVAGTVGRDAVLAGRTVDLTGTLGSTTFAAGNTVYLAEGARVAGGLFAAGRNVDITGAVEGDLYAGARRLVISGRINGNVTVGADRIILEEGAVITGDFTYKSDQQLSQDELAAVQGQVTFKEADFTEEWREGRWWLRVGSVIFTLVALLSGLVFALLFNLFPGVRVRASGRDHARFWTTFAWGLIPFFGFPVAIGALFVAGFIFGITVPIAISLSAGLGLVMFILTALALPEIGGYIARLFGWDLAGREGGAVFVRILIGFVPVLVLGLIPFVQSVIFVIVLALGWGVAIERLFDVRLGEAGE